MFGAFRSPRTIVFGNGQIGALPGHVAALGKRPLLVTDQRMSGEPAFAAVRTALAESGLEVAVFADVEAELPAHCLEAGISAARSSAADVIVAIGGGSCIDAAKIIALIAAHSGAVSDYYGEFKVPGPTVPVVAVPTTSGTGSEVTPVAVVADPGRAVKVGLSSPHLIPQVAICDPDLTASCPPALTAYSGADALVHAVEAYTTARRAEDPRITLEHVFVGKNVLSDAFAGEAIANIARSLARAVADGSDGEARAQLMLGAMQAGLAFGTAGTSICHAVQYPVGALTHTAHGLGVALMLPYALAFNRNHALAEIATIARLMGFASDEADEEAADLCISGTQQLLAGIGIPLNMAEIGIKAEDLPWIAEQALGANRLIKNNPRPVDRAGMDLLVAAAFSGDLAMLTSHSNPARVA